jgi:hypothetical protein
MARSVFAELRGKATRPSSRAFRVVAITLATAESLPPWFAQTTGCPCVFLSDGQLDVEGSNAWIVRSPGICEALPISHEIRIGLRGYLAAHPPFGRPGGRSPYLFVSGLGAPLSISAADGIVQVIEGSGAGLKHGLRYYKEKSPGGELLAVH